MKGGGSIGKSAMAFMDWGAKHGPFFGIVVGGIGIAFLGRDKMKSKIKEFYKEQSLVELEAKVVELEAKMQETRAKMQETMAKMEQQFLRFAEDGGFREEYKGKNKA